jgi:hypothetical protein
LSEASDAVAIVISEETGRIAFCIRGELETVPVSAIRDRIEALYAEDEEHTPPPAPPVPEEKSGD